MTTLQSLAADVGVSDRTLRRAVREGAIRARRPTPRKLEISLSECSYIRRRWPLLSTLRTTLRTEANVRFAMLFGSAATGADGPRSDIDLLVEMTDPSLDRVADLSAKLTQATGRRVDLVRLEDAEADPILLADWIGIGRVLVDREQRWPKLRRRAPGLARRGRESEAERIEAAMRGIDRMLVT